MKRNRIKLPICLLICVLLAIGVDIASSISIGSVTWSAASINLAQLAIPSVDFSFTITHTLAIASGTVQLCSGTYAIDSVDSTKVGSTYTSSIRICLTGTAITGCAHNSDNFPSVTVVDTNGVSNSFSSATISALYPVAAKLNVQLDNIAPTLDQLIITTSARQAFVRAKFIENGSGINRIYAYLSSTTSGSGYLSFNPTPDTDGWYYGTFAPLVNVAAYAYYSMDQLNIYDNAGNFAQIPVNRAIELGEGGTLSDPTPVQPNLLTNDPFLSIVNDYQHTQYVKFDFTYDATDTSPVTNAYASLDGCSKCKCGGVIKSSTLATTYCKIPPYSNNGYYTLQLTLESNSNSWTYPTLKKVKYNNPRTPGINIVSTTFNRQSINQLSKFTLESNLTFSSNGNPFGGYSGSLQYDQYPNDDYFYGTVTVMATLDSFNLNFDTMYEFIYDSTGASEMRKFTGPQVTPRISSPQTFKIDKFIVQNNSIDYVYNIPRSGIPLVFQTTSSKDINSLQIYQGFIQSKIMSYSDGRKGMISGNVNSGTYKTVMYGTPTYSYRSGSYNLNWYSSVESYYGYGTLYSQCLKFILPQNLLPTIQSFSFTPQFVNVDVVPQTVVFTITLDSTKMGNSYTPEYFNIMTEFWSEPCYRSTTSGNIIQFSCSRIFPVESNTYKEQIMLYAVHASGYQVSYDRSFFEYKGFPSVLSVFGRSIKEDGYTRPVVDQFSYDPLLQQVTLSVTAVNSLESVTLVLADLYQEQIIFDSEKSNGIPINKVSKVVSLNISCSAASIKNPYELEFQLKVIDTDAVEYRYTHQYLKELFPSLTIPPVTCRDVSPPRLLDSQITPSIPAVNTASGPTTVTIRLRVSDDRSGVKNMTLQLSTNTNVQIRKVLTISDREPGGGVNDGWYRYDYVVPINSVFTLSISLVSLYDNDENNRPYYSDDITGSVISFSSATPTPNIGLSSYTALPAIVADGDSVTFTMTPSGAVQSVYVEVNDNLDGNNYVTNRVYATYNAATAQYVATYKPHANGYHSYTVTAVGSTLSSVSDAQSYTSSGNKFFYAGNDAQAPVVTSIVTTRSLYTVTGTLSITNFAFDDKSLCLVTDTNTGSVYSGLINKVGAQYVCSVDIPSFSSTLTKTFNWSFNFILGNNSPPRFISTLELNNIFQLSASSSFTMVGLD